MSKAVEESLKYRLLEALFRRLGRMGPRGRARVANTLAWFTLKLARRRVHIARRNIELSFPQASAAQRRQWLHEHIQLLSRSLVDRGVLWYGTPQAVRDMCGLSGLDRIMPLIEANQPFLLLAPHFIGLDAAATRLTLDTPTGATLYKTQSDPAVDALIRKGRQRFNDVHLVSRRDGVRALVRHLRENRPVYYLPDMDFGREGAVFVPFFGVPAATLTATAQLAKRFALPVFPVLEHLDLKTGHYEIEVLPALEDFPGEASLEAATARINRLLQGWIERAPAQYYWVHRRFKTRPEGAPDRYR